MSAIGLLACGAMAPAIASAGQSVRYVSPNGTADADANACTQQAPCELFDAISASNAGDDVRMLGGEYGVGTQKLIVFAGIDLYAADPADPVTISVDDGGSYSVRLAEQAELRDVSVVGNGQNIVLLIDGQGAAAKQVDVLASNGGASACQMTAGLIRGSVCRATAVNSYAVAAVSGGDFAEAALRGVTALSTRGTAVAVSSGDQSSMDLDALNVVASGVSTDVVAFGPGSDAEFDYSNYDSELEIDGGSVTTPGAESNQTAEPLFVDAPRGDLRQAQSSPTIDAGSEAGVEPGEVDLDGADRVQGESVDIGAYEFDSEPPELRITRAPSKRTRSRTATFRFTVRDASDIAFLPGCKLDERNATPCEGSVTYRNLKPGRHTFALTAVDEAGNRGTERYSWSVLRKRKRRG